MSSGTETCVALAVGSLTNSSGYMTCHSVHLELYSALVSTLRMIMMMEVMNMNIIMILIRSVKSRLMTSSTEAQMSDLSGL